MPSCVAFFESKADASRAYHVLFLKIVRRHPFLDLEPLYIWSGAENRPYQSEHNDEYFIVFAFTSASPRHFKETGFIGYDITEMSSAQAWDLVTKHGRSALTSVVKRPIAAADAIAPDSSRRTAA